jgi:hypothetical protein
MIKRRPMPPKEDGFHWEEWRNGAMVEQGYHDGTKLGGEDAHRVETALCQAITFTELDDLYGDKK